MNSLTKKVQRNQHRHLLGRPARLYLWVTSSIFLLQGFLILSGICRTFFYMTDKLEAWLPSSFWWATINLRSCAWLLVVPIIAAIIVDRRSSVGKLALFHLGVVAVAVLVSGNFLHRIAHIQSDQLKHLLDMNTASETNASISKQGSDSTYMRADPIIVTKDYTQKNYEGVFFHEFYGLGYWIGEIMVISSSYLVMNAVGYGVLYFHITEYRTRQAEELRHNLVQLQLETLCNRLKPHFLFNTLNTISSLTLTNGKAARTCISQLGELLRESIESLPKGEIRLEKEVGIIETYLTIQKTRFGEKLNYSIDIEKGLSAVLVPAFVLQPLVENSFQHGFQDHEDIAHVAISVKREGNYCRLEISDNGTKIDPSEPFDEKYGLGLTRERLMLHYDTDGKIFYEPNQPCGLRVIVLVPFHLQNGGPV